MLSLGSVTALITTIPVILRMAGMLATFTHPGHRVSYVPGGSLACRVTCPAGPAQTRFRAQVPCPALQII
ncbi:hypothetical protein DUQ00_20140 [Salmonella bongori]|nr:hypothetical protein [Salmonella bongori]ECC9598559.1 hypothetical protein [Salmonella bongori]